MAKTHSQHWRYMLLKYSSWINQYCFCDIFTWLNTLSFPRAQFFLRTLTLRFWFWLASFFSPFILLADTSVRNCGAVRISSTGYLKLKEATYRKYSQNIFVTIFANIFHSTVFPLFTLVFAWTFVWFIASFLSGLRRFCANLAGLTFWTIRVWKARY